MIVDRGPGRPVFEVLDRMQFTSVNIPLDPAVEEAIIEIMTDSRDVQDYIFQCYQPLRQTGKADISQIEVPKCITDRVSRNSSPTASEKAESSSSTRRTRTPSKSKATKGD